METLWVNFQQKYEYNPVHKHSGLYSFVIWYKIPYNYIDEAKHGPGRYKVKNVNNDSKYEYNQNGCFNFHYPAHNNAKTVLTEKLPVDNSWERTICVFPAWLSHSVNPFYTSDDYRITFSGNIFFNNQFQQ